MTHRHRRTALALIAAAGVSLAGCSSTSTPDSAQAPQKDTITIGYLPAWTDGLTSAYMLEDQLTKLGYDVEFQTLSEAGPIYAGLSQGDIDIFSSGSPEQTHRSYWEEYGDDLEDLGTYYDSMQNFLAVPAYTDVDTIDDLIGQGDRFRGEIIGIEPGAGNTALSQATVGAYGLDAEYDLITSSTPAMLTELSDALERHEDIVVTLWSPFWANAVYDVKPLTDPKGSMGGSEGMHVLATKGFTAAHPDAAELIAGFHLDDDEYGTLENTIVNDFEEGQEREAVDQWIAENPEAFDTLLTQ
ncbi:glycine betaine ABC transporter substrate-binding protein [Microbacterium sp. NPDC096154]|uniref:glycine betaine ABC transporter substrate-binding protein n=1 Tax=Microbacterium sp. NPDC096154 TaxID=3155549 RepID=UPI00331A5C07